MKLIPTLTTVLKNSFRIFSIAIIVCVVFCSTASAKYDRIRRDSGVMNLNRDKASSYEKENGFIPLPEGYSDSGLWDTNEENISTAVIIAASAAAGAKAGAGVAKGASFVTGPLGAAVSVAIGAAAGATIATTTLGIQYENAHDVYNLLRLCGDDWNSYSVKAQEGGVERPIVGSFNNSYSKKVDDCILENKCSDGMSSKLDLSNRTYREYLNRGKEYQDSKCKDVNGNFQKYYARGSLGIKYYCERFLYNGLTNAGGNSFEKYEEAYTCCKERESNAMCLESKESRESAIFCSVGDTCKLDTEGTLFDEDIAVSGSNITKGKICASTVDFAPFDFNLMGGTEFCDKMTDVDSNDPRYGLCSNYYQIDRHCIIAVPSLDFTTNLPWPYLDSSCYFDYSNTLYTPNYTDKESLMAMGAIHQQSRSFSTPIAQCLKETFQNMLLNRTGHKACDNNNKITTMDAGSCGNGRTLYEKGWEINDPRIDEGYRSENNLLQKLQGAIHTIVLLLLYLAVVIYGYNILKAGGSFDKKDFFTFLVKVAFVIYIVFSSAWVDTFMDGIYNSSTALAEMVANVSLDVESARDDGCHFGYKHNYNYESYGRYSYLSIFDTLDCKINKYLGLRSEGGMGLIRLAVINLVPYFGPINHLIMMGIFTILMNMIGMVLRVLVIFISSFIGILLGMFILPILIPSILFNFTKNMFQVWAKYMLRYILYPPLLFMYVLVAFQVYDGVLSKNIIYVGEGPIKEVHCGKYCESGNNIETDTSKCIGEEKNSAGLVCFFDMKGDASGSVPYIGKVLNWFGVSVIIDLFLFMFNIGFMTFIVLILQAVVVSYVLLKLIGIVDAIIQALIGGGMAGGDIADEALSKINLMGLVKGIGKTMAKQAQDLTSKKKQDSKTRGGNSGEGDNKKETSKTNRPGADSISNRS